MPSKGDRSAKSAQDIIDAIGAIEEFIDGYDRQSYDADRRTRSAVERKLLIVAEALGRIVHYEQGLPDTRRFEARFPNIPVYQIRGMGNILRHDYENVDDDTVWATITGRPLKELKAALEKYGPAP